MYIEDIMERYGVARATAYKYIRLCLLPRAEYIDGRAVWHESELLELEMLLADPSNGVEVIKARVAQFNEGRERNNSGGTSLLERMAERGAQSHSLQPQ